MSEETKTTSDKHWWLFPVAMGCAPAVLVLALIFLKNWLVK